MPSKSRIADCCNILSPNAVDLKYRSRNYPLVAPGYSERRRDVARRGPWTARRRARTVARNWMNRDRPATRQRIDWEWCPAWGETGDVKARRCDDPWVGAEEKYGGPRKGRQWCTEKQVSVGSRNSLTPARARLEAGKSTRCKLEQRLSHFLTEHFVRPRSVFQVWGLTKECPPLVDTPSNDPSPPWDQDNLTLSWPPPRVPDAYRGSGRRRALAAFLEIEGRRAADLCRGPIMPLVPILGRHAAKGPPISNIRGPTQFRDIVFRRRRRALSRPCDANASLRQPGRNRTA